MSPPTVGANDDKRQQMGSEITNVLGAPLLDDFQS
jgi:hypothetical protein